MGNRSVKAHRSNKHKKRALRTRRHHRHRHRYGGGPGSKLNPNYKKAEKAEEEAEKAEKAEEAARLKKAQDWLRKEINSKEIKKLSPAAQVFLLEAEVKREKEGRRRKTVRSGKLLPISFVTTRKNRKQYKTM